MDQVSHRINTRQLQSITDRDRAILRFVFENTMATSQQIKKRFFADSRWCYDRVRHLLNVGLLKVIMLDRNRSRVFGLTPFGMSFVREGASPFEDLSKLTPRYYSSVDHDLIVNELRAVFEQCPAVTNFIPETSLALELRKKYGRNAKADCDFKLPDAAVSFTSGVKKHFAAVEVELTQKSRKRLERTFELLITSTDFTLTLFIVKDVRLLTYLNRIYERVWDWPSIRYGKVIHTCYFVTLEEFTQKGADAQFVGRGRSWSFRQLEIGSTVPPVLSAEKVPYSVQTPNPVSAGNDGVAAQR